MSFKSWRSYWDFQSSVITENRYFFNEETKNFLRELLKTSGTREISLKEDTLLFRAQTGNEIEIVKDENGK